MTDKKLYVSLGRRCIRINDARRGVGELNEGEVTATIHLDQREVGTRISADHLGIISFAIISRDLHGLRLVHDVIVGHGITIGSHKEARTLASHELTIWLRLVVRSALII